MSEKDNALRAIETAINVHRAARAKLEEVIAQKNFRGEVLDKERASKARLNRKLADLRDLQVELTAANAVVAAPGVDEIGEVGKLIREINDLAIADAMRQAGFTLIESALARANDLRKGVKLA